jgi:DNA-binding transcriptional ArsR family regulator
MSRAAFDRAMKSMPSFRSLMFAYVQAFLEQVLVSVACNGRHSLKERLARWLLMMRDRSDDDFMPIGQNLLAEMLGVQRPSITHAIAALEGAGLVERYHAPGGPGVRVDSHLFSGYDVPPYYDSLLGKLIVWGPDRPAAIARSRVALDELVIEGLVTNVAIHQAMLENEAFLAGRMTTNMLDRVGSEAFLAAAARS